MYEWWYYSHNLCDAGHVSAIAVMCKRRDRREPHKDRANKIYEPRTRIQDIYSFFSSLFSDGGSEAELSVLRFS